jgi:hypothetical protein
VVKKKTRRFKMKKGIYYVPLFLIIFFTMVGTFYCGDYLGFATSTLSMLLLGEVYYLRFIK